MKILLLGLDSSGKSAIYKKLLANDFSNKYVLTCPTREINSSNIEYKNML